jgi:hypothetical protein
MPRSRVTLFVGVTASVSALVGVLALLAVPVRVTHGAGSMRCEDFGQGGDCPRQLLVNQQVDTAVFAAALFLPALVLFALSRDGRFWSIARTIWVVLLCLYWTLALPLGLLILAGTESAS